MKTQCKIPRLLACLLPLLATLSTARAEDHATFKVADFTFTRPAKWSWVEPSSEMRKAQFKVPDAAAATNAEVVFFLFKNGAGSVQANLDRWERKFQEPKEKTGFRVESLTVGKTKVTYAQGEGTYMSGMPGGALTPAPGFALTGAIIELGDNNIFVTLVGPKDLVKASVPEFKKMIESGLAAH